METRRCCRTAAILVAASLLFVGSINARLHPIRHERQRHRRQYRFHQSVSFGLDSDVEESGPWGSWTESSECSRSCGGGVAFQTRICLDVRSDGSHSCRGPSKRYFSCNIQDCPENARDYRTEQCSRFNTLPFDGKYYSWVPYLKAPNPCELNCMPKGEKFYYRHARKVIDGTRCYDDGTLDVCVDGICMPVGCDMMLGSTVKEDKCRECGGDGSGCRTVEGVFDQDNLDVGYNDILLIPAGATNIKIREKHPTNNYLALRNLTGHYFLNGNWRIEFPRELKFAGTTFHYERKPHGFLAPESIRALGPTNTALFLVLLYQEKNLGIQYEYSVPVGVTQTVPDTYSWTYGDYGQCSQPCGGGVQLRPVSCVQSSSLSPVEEQLCDASVKPPVNRTCNEHPCPARWFIGEWESCTKPCDGVQYRFVYCREVINGEIFAVKKDEDCKDDGPKPDVVRECSTDPDCKEVSPSSSTKSIDTSGSQADSSVSQSSMTPPSGTFKWVTGDWSECSNPCGGTHTREVLCAEALNEEAAKIHEDEQCEHLGPKPETTEKCGQKCLNSTVKPVFEDEKPVWAMGAWSDCSKPCNGIQTRWVHCVLDLDDAAPVSLLDESCEKDEPRPTDTRDCNVAAVCPEWEVGEWSDCDAVCGPGERTRNVECMLRSTDPATGIPKLDIDLPSDTFNDSRGDVLSDDQCDPETKPETTQSCLEMPCEGVEWILSDWIGTCDNGCGVNVQTRKAYCSNEKGKIYPDEMCDQYRLPNLTRSCPEKDECKEALWHTSEWSQCSVKCGTGMKTRHVFCGVWENDLIMKVEDDKCGLDTKPEMTDTCILDPCEGVWFTGPWDRCTSPCGGGHRTRKVLCLHEEKVVPNSNCDVSAKPLAKEDCNMHPCDEDEIMMVGGCKKSRHGCCPDGMTPAGPNFQGCPKPAKLPEGECEKTEFGCCFDGVTPALGAYKKGCPPITNCNKTEFGCCADGITPSKGLDGDGCPENIHCSESPWGCCPDGLTAASGVNLTGCEFLNKTCDDSEFGCCPDGVTFSEGSGYLGCGSSSGENCMDTLFGCCPDGFTIALSPDMEGCPENFTISIPGDCANSTYGCCPDNFTTAEGPDGEGCEISSGFLSDCADSFYGCCPDNITEAMGPDFEGCDLISTVDSIENDTLITYATDDYTDSNVTDTEEPDYSTTDFTASNETETSTEDTSETSSEETSESSSEETTSTPTTVVLTTQSSSLATTTEEEVDCHNSIHGCCPDGKTPALGPDEEGCCHALKHGCCPDNSTAALGPDYLGCGCQTYPYGCCPDGITPASGPRLYGCTCEQFPYGCCQDKYTPARGPDFDGCLCERMVYGCCPDGVTPAIGPRLDGCTCENTVHGCCPDRRTPATGPNYGGCPCTSMHFGCCPDGITAARGPNQQGCPCEATQYGCCPDGHTSAGGPNSEGCSCRGTTYGCCPDGRTPASGRDYAGCSCDTFHHGCCPDGRTPAKGPRYEGCPCSGSPYGCCSDGKSIAYGPNKEGCPDDSKEEKPAVGEVCDLPKDQGTCSNYTVKWFFDMSYGGCSRFWYGGCGGNRNRFSTQEDCETTCVTPEGSGVCLLPKVKGPCPGKYPSWYYEARSGTCEAFTYGGCLGNGNRFASKEECDDICVRKEPLDVCDQSVDAGPCRNPEVRWHFDKSLGRCKPFLYGGCQGNENNFRNEGECQERCVSTAEEVDKEVCILPKDEGTCFGSFPRWYYNFMEKQCTRFTYTGCQGNRNRFHTREQCEKTCNETHIKVSTDVCMLPQSEGPCRAAIPKWYYNAARKSCDQFFYGGCEGNANRFDSRLECEKACNVSIEGESDICKQPKEVGNCHEFREMWYYDYNERQCRRFYYSGCGGNDNNFATFGECEQRCSRDASTEIPDIDFKIEYCFLPQEIGPCTGSETKWYYDKTDGVCKEFTYGGCHGNSNRFRSRKECESKCAKSQDVCRLPRVQGPCSGSFVQWYYDAEQDMCKEFRYSGCHGNGNRFNDKESCMQQCWRGTEKPTPSPAEICRLPQDPGPCLSSFPQWYYDVKENECKVMIYGGCEGNENRFDTKQDCEELCVTYQPLLPPETTTSKAVKPVVTDEEPAENLLAACRLPVEPGPCSESHARWFYDPESQTCLPFVYSGCGGNKNRFKKFEVCIRFCSQVPSTGEGGADDSVKPDMTKSCPPSNCAEIRCPFGVDESVDEQGCPRCHCSNPCKVHSCEEGKLCAVEVYRTAEGEPRAQPVCRLKVKPGICPSNMKGWLSDQPLTISRPECVDRCRTDADCRKEQKCCFGGCGYLCVDPEEEVLEQDSTTTDPRRAGVSSLPDESVEEVEVITKVGSEVSLQCPTNGYSRTLSWSKDGRAIEYTHPRFVVRQDGMLHIAAVEADDAGTYACLADVGYGKTMTRFVKLIVHAPVRILPGPRMVIVRLGFPTILQCNAVGYPVPVVSWWRGSTMLPLSSSRYEQFSNYSLLIRSVTYQDHGLYTCQAYNGIGPLGIWEVTVILDYQPPTREQAIRPYRRNDGRRGGVHLPRLYVNADRLDSDLRRLKQTHHVEPAVETSPSDSPLVSRDLNETTHAGPSEPVVETSVANIFTSTLTPVHEDLSVRVYIATPEYYVGAPLQLDCYVEGTPKPEVLWYFQNETLPIVSDSHRKLLANNTLYIEHAKTLDSGEYKCTAKNIFGESSASVSITVEGTFIPPSCTDSPYFANCDLIIKARYCANSYYAKFCCRSCMAAGQITRPAE